jgi:phytanoyl-CoA hydroxylase
MTTLVGWRGALLASALMACCERARGEPECAAADDRFAAAAADFSRDGYAVLRGLLSPEEVDEIEAGFDSLAHPSEELRAAMGRDYGDQSQGHGVDPADFALINVNNPGRYLSGFSQNRFVDQAAAAAAALLGEGATLDYEQLLEKRPNRTTAVFPWHQDMQYWPKRFPDGVDTRTATFSLALTDASEANGCLRVIPGSGVPKQLLSDRSRDDDAARAEHTAANTATDATGDERAIVLPLDADELARATTLPVRRGDVTVHDEWVVHGSGGNPSGAVRKTYVVAFRDAAMVAYERSLGFHHSYNDSPEVLRRIREGEL